ncbi:hypothetical protein P152DRAFT_478209 [Eremomyces bilateralis CBS 781.70]|uniref:Uncharacterized protein n=1 Tax=Eremomyces bilateralis CBS 781.70 TaxID=1392243 RepID=A0A6G1GGP5_9PEZI|nr:uncharacterized protein P152DRAFT_478209 [Eremomyces bilateralis CBS 781.70]KAF1817184.1 hypothetical protein P152DRAFT_478209 [Eremomyces bilateralis CBS 781.70]
MQQHTRIPYDRRTRSVLFSPSSPLPAPDQEIFEGALLALNKLVEEPTLGIASLVIDQGFMDIVSATAWYSFGGNTEMSEEKIKGSFERLVDRSPISRLLFTFTALMSSPLPELVQAELGRTLARLPLRPGGVLQTIEFIAGKHARAGSSTPVQGGQPEALPLPLEALQECAKLFSALPRGEDSSFFYNTGQQLIELLGEKAGPELSKAAAFIIAQGILNKKSSGAPGAWGWNFYVKPLIELLNPPPYLTGGTLADPHVTEHDTSRPWVKDSDVWFALNLLGKLVMGRPHASIAARIIPQVFLSLWAISIFSKVHAVDPAYETLSMSLLKAFFLLVPSIEHLKVLRSRLLWDGPLEWTFGPGSHGGVEIRGRKGNTDFQDFIQTVKKVDIAVYQFIDILSSARVADEEKASIYLAIIEDWLLSQDSSSDNSTQIGSPVAKLAQMNLPRATLEDELDKVSAERLLRMKLAQAILKSQSRLLIATPKRTLELVIRVFHARLQAAKQRNNGHKFRVESIHEGDNNNPEEDTILAIALEILDLVVRTGVPEIIEESSHERKEIFSLLRRLLLDVTPPLNEVFRDSMMAVLRRMEEPGSALTEVQGIDADNTLKEHLRLLAAAEESLIAQEPPIRRQAIQDITRLIQSTSKVRSALAFAAMLIDAIEVEEDDFVFQPAIDAFVALAMKSDHMVVSMALQAFDDYEEKMGIDSRQRLAEALIRLTKNKAEDRNVALRMNWQTSARDMARKAIQVASRRGARSREMNRRIQDAEQKQELESERSEAWGGDAPDAPLIEPVDNEEDRLDAELLTNIIMGWQETGKNEDVRIRVSALSILAQLLESALDLFVAEYWERIEELTISILFMERGPEKAILRRNAVLIFLSTLLALDSAQENGDSLDFVAGVIEWTRIEKVLLWVLDMDEDELVKDHVGSVLESLEAWRMKMLLNRNGREQLSAAGLSDDLQGLDVNPLKDKETSKKPVIEEID